ncbi:hypothetical protein BKA62DRAFT_767412 [Auriculariales sp. MPI-PUGE-AT-0066]|nr:hypothetical protein BKA62DRAFT_767412 [Auriculariales sp. MPI-PUGE-AT-0066]
MSPPVLPPASTVAPGPLHPPPPPSPSLSDSNSSVASELPPPSPLFSSHDGTDDASLTDSMTETIPLDHLGGNIGSPAPSVYSLTESLIANSVKTEHGRKVQNHSEVYSLPADNPEFERLDNQHKMITLVLGKYPVPMYDVLRDDNDDNQNPDKPQKAVLDLGCGTGAWLADVAVDFPHVECVGVDLVPPQITYAPPNVRTEIDDINLGLEHFFGCFDVVQCRLICMGVKDYAGLVDQISRILRPGGLVILGECDFRVYTDKDGGGFELYESLYESSAPKSTVPEASSSTSSNSKSGSSLPVEEVSSKKPPSVARFMQHVRTCAKARGGSLDAAMLLHRWVSQHRSFKEVVARDVYFPLAPFAKGDSSEAKRQRKIGRMCRDDTMAFLSSGRVLCLKGGIPGDVVDTLVTEAHAELAAAEIPVYLRLHCIYARKK